MRVALSAGSGNSWAGSLLLGQDLFGVDDCAFLVNGLLVVELMRFRRLPG
jgi:hypothetical protein